MEKILLKNVRIIDEDSERNGDILISDGIIENVGENLSVNKSTFTIDGKGRLAVFPGLFDMHVHFRDPGFTYKEDIISGAEAAICGGFTGVACMPNTKPTIDNADTIKYIINKAKYTGVSVYPVASITKGLAGQELCDYLALKNAGAVALSDDGRPVENADVLLNCMKESKENGMLIISHCEDLNIIKKGIINKGEISERLNVKGMDRASEDSITAREIALADSCGARIHIAHVSTKGSIALIRDAKRRGVKVTCETCPHYFTFTDKKLLTRDADYRMNPPLREESDRLAVLEAVLDGTVDCIVTDHAPHTKEEKADFLTAPNGVVGLETSLAATLTALYHTKKASLSKISRLMSSNPRKILGLPAVKIENGAKADLCVVDLDKTWIVDPDKLHSKSHNTVFKGEVLKGKNIITIAGGVIKYSELN